MVKKYLPVRIWNPISTSHLVRVLPGQAICIFLDAHLYPNPKIDVCQTYLQMTSFEMVDDVYVIKIEHFENVHAWSLFSTSFIGDIWIDSARNTARLEVMLSCDKVDKKNFVTVVNPDLVDICFHPWEVMEIVLYDSKFEGRDSWQWFWKPVCDIEIEPIGYSFMCLSAWRQYCDQCHFPYARMPRTFVKDNPLCRQHHFWFRFSEVPVTKMAWTKYVGELTFLGWSDKDDITNVSPKKNRLYVSLNFDPSRANLMETIQTLPKLSEMLSLTSSTFWVQEAEKARGPQIHDVQVKLKEHRCLDENCKIVSSMPSEGLVVWERYENPWKKMYAPDVLEHVYWDSL